jgi:hypothetical protein
MYPKLKIDIKRGAIFEDYIEGYFKRRGYSVKRAKGYTPAYDLIVTKGSRSFYLECKHDILSDVTGNYALEFDSLSHSKSDYLVIGTPKEFCILSMDDARRLRDKFPSKQTGDFVTNFSALVPKHIVKGCSLNWN